VIPVFAVAPLLALITPSPADDNPGSRGGKPASTAEVAEVIAAHFSLARAKVTESTFRPSRFGPGCPQLRVVGPAHALDIRSPDPTLFAGITVYVERMTEKQDGYRHVADMIKADHDRGDESCGYSKAPIAFIERRPFWISVRGHCSDGALFRYEVGEVLASLPAEVGAPADRFLFGGCGQGFPTVTTVTTFLDSLRAKKKVGGKAFPDARDAAKARGAGRRPPLR
jgi:hypothetical protein